METLHPPKAPRDVRMKINEQELFIVFDEEPLILLLLYCIANFFKILLIFFFGIASFPPLIILLVSPESQNMCVTLPVFLSESVP